MDWLTAERARAYRRIVLAVTIAVAAGAVLTARHSVDLGGKPLGTDFLAFWSAATLAGRGAAGAAYDLHRLYAVERAALPVDPGVIAFLYPPPFLLLCLPLGWLPYLPALSAWLIATGAGYVAVVRRWLGGRSGATTIALAYPAVLSNAGHGQNGFLTAALLGGGLWLLERRPWLAGLLLGLLVVKPQVALAVPVLLVAGRHGRVALAAGFTALGACLAAWFVLGAGSWTGFLGGARVGGAILAAGLVEPGKMVSVFATIRVLGGGVVLAYAAQGAAAMAAAAVLAAAAQRASVGGQAALAIAGSALMSPFLLDYDLTILAIPLAWLFGEGVRRGFLPWEKAVLVAGFALPLVARTLALGLGVPIAPLVAAALFAACRRAVTAPAPAAPPPRSTADR